VFEHPKSWRLVRELQHEGAVEEAVFKLQGILTKKDLLPLEETPRCALLPN
jgi:hypothetical protein